jgi:surface antigen
MDLKKLLTLAFVITASLMPAVTKASLDLLAGVEAGIDSNTAMTSYDLDKTQEALSTLEIGTPQYWINENTGIRYKIIIERTFSYGRHPCLAYNLNIMKGEENNDLTLNACRDHTFRWISLNPDITPF